MESKEKRNIFFDKIMESKEKRNIFFDKILNKSKFISNLPKFARMFDNLSCRHNNFESFKKIANLTLFFQIFFGFSKEKYYICI